MIDDAPTTADLDTPPPTVNDKVGTHLACISCQYDLHNLPVSGKCPECGWDIAATLTASKLDHDWLGTIRIGMRWLVASMYVFAYLVATRYFGSMEFVVVALMQFGAALSLTTPNPNRPRESSITRWPIMLFGAALAIDLLSSASWIDRSELGWFLLMLGVAMHAGALALLWFRVGAVAAQGIAPKSTSIARNIGVLTIIIGVLTFLPALLWQFGIGLTFMGKIIGGVRLLQGLALLVWFFASVVTLHLMGVTLRRLVKASER